MATYLTAIVMMAISLGSVALGVIAAGAMITYMRRTWQLIHADEGGSSRHEQILDGLDRIETRLDAMSERLARVEERRRLHPGEAGSGTGQPS